jgi:hypothetical protein
MDIVERFLDKIGLLVSLTHRLGEPSYLDIIADKKLVNIFLK